MNDGTVHPISTIAETPLVRVGRLEISSENEAWSRLNRTGPRPTLAFPARAIETTAEGGPARVIAPATGIFANPDWPYRRRMVDPRGERSTTIEFDPSLVRAAVARHDPERGESNDLFAFRFGEGCIDDRLFAEQALWLNALERDPAPDPLSVEETAIGLLDRALDSAWSRWPRTHASSSRPARRSRPATDRAHAEAVRHACRVIAESPAARHSLTSVGQAVHMAPHHFCRVFRVHTGLTVHEYVTQVRLRAALESLSIPPRSGRRPADLETLARTHGFADRSHFTRVCRRRFGIGPAELRRRLGRR